MMTSLKVDFSVTIRDGREVASQIFILPRHFPMEFDEISEHGKLPGLI